MNLDADRSSAHLTAVSIPLNLGHPNLFAGLEDWLQRGLLSHRDVRRLAQTYLVCELVLEPRPTTTLSFPPPRTGMVQLADALMAEVSVLWLLFLGVFMVIVSSAVLAATQWQQVPALGQYGILLGYTGLFGGISFWAMGRFPFERAAPTRLPLTAQMLRMATLLLIPVNFWVLDGFGLWRQHWAVSAIAAIGLTGLLIGLLPRSDRTPIPIAMSAGLSWLHTGWGIPGIPLIATYVGTVGATVGLGQWRRWEDWSGAIGVVFGSILLIGRALLGAGVHPAQLGLAWGLCGWLVSRLARSQDWERIGSVGASGLFLLGWMVSVNQTWPWQTFAVGALAIVWVCDRIRRQGSPIDLMVFLILSISSGWLLWRLMPSGLQTGMTIAATRWFGDSGQPWALLGLSYFPQLVLMSAIGRWLYRRQNIYLANWADSLTIGLGVVLCGVSAANAGLLALQSSLSLLVLGWMGRDRASQPWWIYLTHIVGVGTILAWIAAIFPTLGLGGWIGVAIALIGLEWNLPWRDRVWQQSGWIFGCGLAGISYVMLWEDSVTTSMWPWMWGIVVALLAYRLWKMPIVGGAYGFAIVMELWLARLVNITSQSWMNWSLAILLLAFLTIAWGQSTSWKESARLHWGIGTVLLAGIWLGNAAEAIADPVWARVGVTLGYASYAALEGRQLYRRENPVAEPWTYAGIVQLAIALIESWRAIVPGEFLMQWGAVIAGITGLGLYYLPWETWGWPVKPWQRSILGIPLVLTLGTSDSMPIVAILLMAGFYSWLAQEMRVIRLTYVSLVIGNWAILKGFAAAGITDEIIYGYMGSLSLLYVAHIDPSLTPASQRELRHGVRCFAIAILAVTIAYQAEMGLADIPPVLLGFGAIAAFLGMIAFGLSRRIRAFLYVGTVAFVLRVLWQGWNFISEYSFALWAAGIFLGMGLIWVALTFEARRSQVYQFMMHWVNELETWE